MCGPTVYDDSHIGHACSYVKFDIIRRIMEKVFNINVLLLIGVTDIDDKIIKKAQQQNRPIFEISKRYEVEYFDDMKMMGVLPPTRISRVSESIPLIISFCAELIKNGYAYVTKQGSVYFVVSKGISSDLAQEMPAEVEATIDPEKKDPRDFALWKAAKPGEPFWSSPWGEGRPGWHIECSAMASHIFGSQLDIHSGGSDLLFPHHCNEKSQSEAYHGCSQWVNYWLHAGLLQLQEDTKMSKSVGNTITVKEFLRENSANDFRILCLQSLYRKNIIYNTELLSGAQALHKKFHTFINESELYIKGELGFVSFDGSEILQKLSSTKEKIISLLANDFNSSQALLCLTDLIDEVNKCLQVSADAKANNVDGLVAVAACMNYVDSILEILGVTVICKKRLPLSVVHVIDEAVKFRNQIRLLALHPITLAPEQTQTCSEYLECIYNSSTNKMKIISEICSEKAITETEKILGIYRLISQAVDILYDKTSIFMKMEQMNDFYLMKKEKMSKEDRKKMSPLLTLCDEFRSSVQELGIGIKDRSDASSWIPLVNYKSHM
ncbi:probable cysteine--tRNA ligase, mitochondrial isoform X2 [Uloborus diversus]|nr:probable cysteine--tRNA ligase, mitochondrial isoform X2 [Uloborus diversus]